MDDHPACPVVQRCAPRVDDPFLMANAAAHVAVNAAAYTEPIPAFRVDRNVR